MATRDGHPRARNGLEPGKAAGGKLASDALREEAERGWAESDVKATKARRRTQSLADRRGKAREGHAEVQRLRGKLARAERALGRKAK